MARRVLYLCMTAGIGLLVLLSGCARQDAAAAQFNGAATDDDGRILVRVVEVQRSDFVEYGRYFGEVRGIRQATLQSVSGGTVEELHAQPGDPVRRGQSLARIEAERAETGWQTARLAEQLAHEDYQRESQFLEQGLTSRQRVDQLRLQWLRSRSNRIDAEAVREGALAISPLDGIVTARHVELYDELVPGAPTYSVADLSRMKVTVGVPEADIAGVRRLGDARISFVSFPDRSWSGETTSFARRRSERGLTFDVEIELDNSDGALLAGQTARVELALRTHPNSVQIPSRAIVTRAGQPAVFVVEEGVAVQRPLRTGPSDTSHTLVLEGLGGNELLVVEGMNRVTDGSPVRSVVRE